MKRPNAALEAERRFVIPDVPAGASVVGLIHQGYLLVAGPLELRVRTGAEHSVAAKFARGHGRRLEIETGIHAAIAKVLHRISPWKLSKTRSVISEDGQRWDIDSYHGTLDGIVTAEAETDEFASLQIPTWVGREVTGVAGWSNRSLARYGKPTI